MKIESKYRKVMKMSEITDALEAARIVTDHLSKKGIVVFAREIRSIFRNSMIWVVELDSDKFTGSIIIKSKTGEVAKELLL